MKYRLLLLILLLFYQRPVGALENGNQIDIPFFRQDYTQAIEIYNQAIQKHPNDFRFYLKRGESHQYIGQLKQAQLDFQQALALKPNSDIVYAHLSWLYIFTGELPKAIDIGHKLLKNNPHLVWGLLNLGTAYLLSDQYEQAWSTYQQGLGLVAGDMPFSHAIYQDFQLLRQRGISHPDMAKIEAALGFLEPVQIGLEVLLNTPPYLDLLRNRRVAVITNQTGIDRQGRHNYTRLQQAGIQVVRIFAPEHGYQADTDIEVITLYGKHLKPTPEMLKDIDVLVFDIQDIGARFYTYASTMVYAMQAASENNKLVMILDRPNPLGGQTVRGNILQPDYASFVGLYPIPIQHGMTLGELARMYNQVHHIKARLIVVPLQHWQRFKWFDQNGFPWHKPSPSIPTLESAIHYPGTCLFEGTNLSVGRGTAHPFEQVGAPWLNHKQVLKYLERNHFYGVEIKPISFTPINPDDQKFSGQICQGFRLQITDRQAYDPLLITLHLLKAIRLAHPTQFKWWEKHFDRLMGTDHIREQLIANASITEIMDDWEQELIQFKATRDPYLLY